MKHFLILNRHKILFGYGVIALLHLAIVVLSGSILWLIDEPIPENGLAIALMGIFLGPIVWLFAAYIDWQMKSKRRQRLFTTSPIAQLRDHGFSTAKTNTQSKWHFSHFLLAGKSRGFWLLIDVLDDEHPWGKVNKRKCIEVKAFVAHRQLDPSIFKSIQSQFEVHHMRFGLKVIKKLIHMDPYGPQNTSELLAILDEFTALLTANGFVPQGTQLSIPIQKGRPNKPKSTFYKPVDNEDILMDLISKN